MNRTFGVVVCVAVLGAIGGAAWVSRGLKSDGGAKGLSGLVTGGITAGGTSSGGATTGGGGETYEVEHTDYTPPPVRDELTDDVLDPARVPAFDPSLVHSQPLGEWQVNLSDALFQLDVPMVLPDHEAHLETLHRSYAEALRAAQQHSSHLEVLPSVNLIDGKAKQFDDGLYAALDCAYYRGLQGERNEFRSTLRSHIELVQRIAERVGPDSPAAPYLAAGLEIAGVRVPVSDVRFKSELIALFDANLAMSKPIGFYTWNDDLRECFRFLRFFQQEISLEHPQQFPAVQDMARALAEDDALRAEYEQAIAFYARLTNSMIALSIADLIGTSDPAALRQMCKDRGLLHEAVAVFPASTSRETVLFERMFPEGLPPDTDLMQALIRAVRSGAIDLTPTAESGWYEHQAYALETLLLPERAEEADKLLLSARYKRRMLDAFAALVTKRRETHVRQLAEMDAPKAMRERIERLAPTLRVEPNPTYYLRTARAYAFLQNFLEAAIGREALAALHGLKADGERTPDLAAELDSQRELFYGMYLVSAEDIGLPSSLMAEELADPAAAMQRVLDWLQTYRDDADLAVDTRVVVPIGYNLQRQSMNLWGTAGVRLAKLNVSFEPGHAPQVRPLTGGEWERIEPYKLEGKTYLIAVDEFVTAERLGMSVPTREEYRALCDGARTKEGIVKALRGR